VSLSTSTFGLREAFTITGPALIIFALTDLLSDNLALALFALLLSSWLRRKLWLVWRPIPVAPWLDPEVIRGAPKAVLVGALGTQKAAADSGAPSGRSRTGSHSGKSDERSFAKGWERFGTKAGDVSKPIGATGMPLRERHDEVGPCSSAN